MYGDAGAPLAGGTHMLLKITIPQKSNGSLRLSRPQLLERWPELGDESRDIEVLDPEGGMHQLRVSHQLVPSRTSLQHRFCLTGAVGLLSALCAQPGDELTVVRTEQGMLSALVTPKAQSTSPREGPQRNAAVPQRSAGCKRSFVEPEDSSIGQPQDSDLKAEAAACPDGSGGDDTSLGATGVRLLKMGSFGPTLRRSVRGEGRDGNALPPAPLLPQKPDPPTLAHAPMKLLPGEEPLGIETFFGEGLQLVQNGSTADRRPSQIEPPAAAPVPPLIHRYQAAVERARQGMAAKAMAVGGQELRDQAARVCSEFERVCLAGPPHDMALASVSDVEPATPDECRSVVAEYDAVLRLIYPRLTLDPHVMSAAVLEQHEGSEELQLLRCMQRRFILWEQPAERSGGGAAEPRCPSWSAGLLSVWDQFVGRLQGRRYGDVNLACADTVSSLNDTEWRDGKLTRQPLRSTTNVMQAVDAARSGKRRGRLYITDGSMPDYRAAGYPEAAPGMPCQVDSAVNALLPHAVRSSRGTNLFNALKVESTGTRTFTFFAPAGGGPNLTAFHYETKKRRSYNLGSGDYIIQPLATADNARSLMRVHAAAAGAHTRHGQLMPLEVYLEEGVQLVTHIRSGGEATLCELCQQSMHAFVSFGDISCTPPALKASCNDFDLAWEMDAAYFLEKLAVAYQKLHALHEEAPPADGADTWIQSAYLLKDPCTLVAKRAADPAAPRPWLCEVAGAQLRQEAVADGEMHWGMEVVAVRCVEKLLDVLSGALRQEAVAGWAGELPTEAEAWLALRRVECVLRDMHSRAASEQGPRGAAPRHGVAARWESPSHFSREYLQDLLQQVEPHLQAPEVGSPGGRQPRQPKLQRWWQGLQHWVGAGERSPSPSTPSELHGRWIQCLQLEWEAAMAKPVDFSLLAERRRERSGVERAWDEACARLAPALGAAAS